MSNSNSVLHGVYMFTVVRACYTVDALFTVLLLDVTFRRIESLLIDCLYILQVSATVVTL